MQQEARPLSLEQRAVCISEMAVMWRIHGGRQVGVTRRTLAAQLPNVEMGKALVGLSPCWLPGDTG